MKRRDFIKGTAILVAAAGASNALKAADKLQESSGQPDVKENPEETCSKLIVSDPMLQNYAETSMGVAFGVSSLANGYVLVGEQPDLSDAVKVKSGGFRMTEINDKVIQVRLTGLKPATKYYYRVGADSINYIAGNKIKITGNEEDPRIHSFTTAGKEAKAHFCVINDTHVHWDAIERAWDKIAALSPSCVIWNGDASNIEETIDRQIRIFIKPEIDRKDYASDLPYLFCPGNHDDRGMANRHLENVWMFRQPEERSSRDWDLGRNFAVRMGDIALIGLDTAEDKLDTNPRYAFLFKSEPYREAQVAWLEDALKRKEIASAPYLVAFCHIPLFDDDPTHNPGDIAPADTDPRYKHTFALWQRTCAKLWGPALQKAGCQLLITAHQHKYRYDAPTADRCWAQIVGGGPELKEEVYPTVIEGEVVGHTLKVTVHNLLSGQIQDTFTFKPRKKGKRK